MKTRFLLSFFSIAIIILLISGYENGPAYHSGIVATGASSAYSGCGNNGSCHGTTTNINAVIELDSAGVPVKTYYPGIRYSIKISATNTTNATLSHFGFQMTSVLAAGSGTHSPVAAGTWDSTGLPSYVRYIVVSGLPVIEHVTPLPANSGSGAVGTVYADSVSWTAPDSGAGTIILAGALNAVNFDSKKSGDSSMLAPPDTIMAAFTNMPNGLSAIAGLLNGYIVYPTLMNDNVSLAFDLKTASQITISLIASDGQTVKELMPLQAVSPGSFRRSFDVTGLPAGIYLILLQADSSRLISKVVKE